MNNQKGESELINFSWHQNIVIDRQNKNNAMAFFFRNIIKSYHVSTQFFSIQCLITYGVLMVDEWADMKIYDNDRPTLLSDLYQNNKTEALSYS